MRTKGRYGKKYILASVADKGGAGADTGFVTGNYIFGPPQTCEEGVEGFVLESKFWTASLSSPKKFILNVQLYWLHM